MPLITASHFFASSAGIRPANAVLTGFAVAPHVFAGGLAMSTSKPMIAPLGEVSSIGGNVGFVQYLNVPALFAAPAIPTTASASVTARARPMVVLRIAPPLLLPVTRRLERNPIPPASLVVAIGTHSSRRAAYSASRSSATFAAASAVGCPGPS